MVSTGAILIFILCFASGVVLCEQEPESLNILCLLANKQDSQNSVCSKREENSHCKLLGIGVKTEMQT